MDSAAYAAEVRAASGKECLVYKCVNDAQFENWIRKARAVHGHRCLNVVGRPSADGPAKGPTTKEAMALVEKTSGVSFGCVCIPERHTDEYAQRRGKAAPGEHLNMLRKQQAGAEPCGNQPVSSVVDGPKLHAIEQIRNLISTQAPSGSCRRRSTIRRRRSVC